MTVSSGALRALRVALGGAPGCPDEGLRAVVIRIGLFQNNVRCVRSFGAGVGDSYFRMCANQVNQSMVPALCRARVCLPGKVTLALSGGQHHWRLMPKHRREVGHAVAVTALRRHPEVPTPFRKTVLTPPFCPCNFGARQNYARITVMEIC